MVRSIISSMVLIMALTIGCQELPNDPSWLDVDTDLANREGSQSVVGLASEGDYIAGGTGVLITPTLVLTTGHGGTSECSDMSIPRHFVVRVGQDSKYPIEEIKVIKEIEHPDYGRGNPSIGTDHCGGGWGIDLGIWVLEHAPKHAQPITNFGSIEVYDLAVMFGYGPSPDDNNDSYGKMKVRFGHVDVILYNMKQGNPPYPNGGKRLLSRDIDSNPGDSGGPYFNERGELVGIHTSHNNMYAFGQILDPYLGWIMSVIDQYEE